MYKIEFHNRQYNSWTISNISTSEIVTFDNFNPNLYKLFTNDEFNYCQESGEFAIIKSQVRELTNIAAVLVLEDGKTFGYENKMVEGKTYTSTTLRYARGRPLYKCVPDDPKLPPFCVPYESRDSRFSKAKSNSYVTITYFNWEDKHPQGRINQNIGPVDVLSNFYEYQWYCKQLNASIREFEKLADQVITPYKSDDDILIHDICSTYPNITDRTHELTFTIDNHSTLDFDDAVSIKKDHDNKTVISIYIANVAIMLDFLNILPWFSERVSTIYLPNKKKQMIPSVLSHDLCSLKENKKRIAFAVDFTLDPAGNILSIKYANAIICVNKNYTYESNELLTNIHYYKLFEVVNKMSKIYQYIPSVTNSIEVIEYLMVLTNYHCATKMTSHKKGVFRSTNITSLNNSTINMNNDVNVDRFITFWNSNINTKYVDIATLSYDETLTHLFLKVDAYVHITSPIRRIVDLMNQISFQTCEYMIEFKQTSLEFYNKWINKLEFINDTMKAIRRVQLDCQILSDCMDKPQELLYNTHECYYINKTLRDDGLFNYVVYLPKLKLVTYLKTRDEIELNKQLRCRLYLFNDEERFRRKIRVQPLDSI
jgi:exoribonuclease R